LYAVGGHGFSNDGQAQLFVAGAWGPDLVREQIIASLLPTMQWRAVTKNTGMHLPEVANVRTGASEILSGAGKV
jgi:hypothetical protein